MTIKSVQDSNPLLNQEPGKDTPISRKKGALFSDTVREKKGHRKKGDGQPADTEPGNRRLTHPDSQNPIIGPRNNPTELRDNPPPRDNGDGNSPPAIKNLSPNEYEQIAKKITTAGKSPPMRIFSKVDFRDVPNDGPKPGLRLLNRSGSPRGNSEGGAPVYGASHQIPSERIADEFGLKNPEMPSNGKPKYSFYVMPSKNFDNGEPAVKIGNKIFINEDAYRDWQNGGDGNGLADWLAEHVS